MLVKSFFGLTRLTFPSAARARARARARGRAGGRAGGRACVGGWVGGWVGVCVCVGGRSAVAPLVLLSIPSLNKGPLKPQAATPKPCHTHNPKNGSIPKRLNPMLHSRTIVQRGWMGHRP